VEGQNAIASRIVSGLAQTVVLHGVTPSGVEQDFAVVLDSGITHFSPSHVRFRKIDKCYVHVSELGDLTGRPSLLRVLHWRDKSIRSRIDCHAHGACSIR
jgi:hypothetical protein